MDERPPIARWLALLALVALVASGGTCAWEIVNDQVDFRRAADPAARGPSD